MSARPDPHDDTTTTDGTTTFDSSGDVRDRGAILPIVLVVSVVLSAVVVAVASYATTTLRYGQVVERRADRLAAAEAAMNDALERLRIVDGLCTTSTGGGEIVNPSFPEINGVPVAVRCTPFGNELPPSDGWAIVITGESPGAGSGATFITTAGGNPILEGPVFVHDPNRIDFKDTTIKKGSLWYTDPACAGAGADAELTFQDSSVVIDSLSFDPDTRKVYCVNRTWQQLFAETPPANVPPSDAPPADMHESCKVFSPGRYHSGNPLVLASNNYFRSGEYLFDHLGEISLSHTRMTFGTIDPEIDPTYPLLDLSSDCEEARQLDFQEAAGAGADPGATLYLDGNTRFRIDAQSQLEIAGRQQGSYITALHALPSATAPNIITTGSGNHKESAFSGLVWAPRARVEVGTVAAQKEAAFRGGIVIGAFEGTISAAPSGGFLIRVPTSQASVSLLLEAVAEKNDERTTVRVIADYRPSRGDLAVESWRVCPVSGC